ncbi:MAG: L-threonylcarbamoyladenylate synthase [Acutalibacteraceae bacterium]|nr:L-threonylcarbamoyladenylate synthase [Acutalibacteraceae bacterium]
MNTLLLKDDANGILTAAKMISQGKVVAIPTETVYGLGANAFDENAVKNVFVAKGRPQDNPLIVHIADSEDIFPLTSLDKLPKEVIDLAENFWPGPLTMVLPKSDKIPSVISAGLDTVAIRMPSNEIARQIIRHAKVPVAAPSANLSGKPSPTAAKHVIEDLSGKIDAIVVSGDCTVGVESTVIFIGKDEFRLLRPGKITVSMLEKVLGKITVDKAVLSDITEEKVSSPGMKYKHYSPNTELYLVEGSSDEFKKFILKNKAFAICFEEDNIFNDKIVYGSIDNLDSLAQGIFKALRQVDTVGVQTAYVHAPCKEGVGLAVYNRLLRACAFKVIKL